MTFSHNRFGRAIYSSLTYAGMSGGPVFNTAGQVVGIHGKAEGIDNGIRKNILGNSLGISINTFLNLFDKLGMDKKRFKNYNLCSKRSR